MTSGTARITVLVVDDDPSLLRVVTRTLTAHAEVVSAADAGAARLALEARTFDVVISDYGLPGEDGLSLLAHVAIVQPDAKRILFSGAPPEDVDGKMAVVHHVVAKSAGAGSLVPYVRK